MIFNAREDAPLGAEPETEGDSREGFKLCHDATSGLVQAIEAVRANPDLSDAGRAKAIERLQAERKPLLDRAAALVKREQAVVASSGHEMKAAAGISAAAADSAAGWRAQEIRAAFALRSASERNGIVHNADTDRETLLALMHAPVLTNLLSQRDREAVEERLLIAHDSARYAAHTQRAEDLRRLSYALSVSLGFVGRNRVAGIRERIGAAPESPGAPGVRERLLAAKNKAD